jgi:hypothetical protein
MSAVLTEFTTRAATEYRKPVLTRIDVSWQDTAGIWQTLAARMEDRSTGGACIRVKLPIEAGSKVRIQSRLDDFSGTARHCRADGREFLIGIQRDVAEDVSSNQGHDTNRQKSKPGAGRSVDPVQGAAIANLIPARQVDDEIDNPDILTSRSRNFVPPFLAEVTAQVTAEVRAELRSELRTYVRAALQAELQTQLQTKQTSTQPGKEEKPMRSKWLDLPWSKKPEDPSMSAPDFETSSDGTTNTSSEKENSMSDLTQPAQKPIVRSAREVPGFQVDLSPTEEIYRAAGIMNPTRGYSITKVVEMLNSEHIRDLSADMKRAAVLMALEAAGTTIEQLQKDAKARQDALDAHEAQQRKQVEAEWARKAEEVVQIQAEMESIKAHYTARISRNLDGVARQKAAFAEWVSAKQQECQAIAETIELCSKSPATAPASDPSAEVSLVKVNAKTV